jgi:hypothetical protein
VGIAYGSSISFTTDPLTLALVDIDSVTGITSATANSGGNVTEDGGAAVSGRGICWSLNSAPTINDNKTTDGSGTGSYTSAISGILPNTTYYTRAYATNITGTGYSATLSLTTLSIALPELTTRNATVITQNSALSGGTIIKDGNSSITAKGVCWSTNPGPTTDDEHTNDGSGKNGFTSEITNLEVNTKYYIRSYAVNSVGTGYGPQVQLTTLGYYTGLVYGGGVIFYVDSTGRHGLIAAINDQGTDKYWYNGLFVQTGATARAIGSGNSNTQLIVSHMVGTGFAAEICYHLSLGGYDDWFLPSQDELSTLFNLQGTGQLSDNFYWSSTESGSTGIGSGAWYSSGNSFGYGNELFKAWVRAIRAF